MSFPSGLKCYASGTYSIETEYDDNPTPIVLAIKGLSNDEWIDTIGIHKTITDSIHINDCFLIVLPLSDLTKPITHKGEAFIPMLRLSEEIINGDWYMDAEYARIENDSFCFALSFRDNNFYMEDTHKCDYTSVENQLQLFQKLIEWHFDIAGLIEKGEAIDVNSLELNPYK